MATSYIVRTNCPYCGNPVYFNLKDASWKWAESRKLHNVVTKCYAYSECIQKALRKNRKKVKTDG